MNPFVAPYQSQQSDPSNRPAHLRPPKQFPPTNPVHRRRGWTMFFLFGMIAWLGIDLVFQWYYTRQINMQLEQSHIESQQISERIQHQIDKKLEEVRIE